MHILLLHFCWWKRSVSLGFVFSLKEAELSMEHMVTVACDSPPALPLNHAALYSILPPPSVGEPITLCHRLKQQCHLTILSQIWKHVYLCEMTTGLSLWRKTLSCPVCLRAVKNGAGWQMRAKANKMWEKRKQNIRSCKYVTTVSLKKTFSPKHQQCSLCE